MTVTPLRLLMLIVFLPFALPGVADDKSQSTEFMLDELESLNQFSAYGRKLYQDDDNQQNGIDYCTVSMQFAELGEFRQSLRQASKTLFLGEKTGKSYLLAIGTRNLALAYSYANDLANAERYAKIVIDKYDNEGLQVIGPAYKVMGDIRLRQGRYNEASEFYEIGLNQSPTWMEAMLLANLARSYALGKQFDKARKFYDKAIARAENAPENTQTIKLKGTFGKVGDWMAPTLLRGQAELAFLQGDYARAIELYDAIKQAADTDPYQGVWLHAGKARALWAKGDKTAALAAIEQAITVAEGLRAQFRSEEIKIGLFSDVQDVFDDAIDMYMAEGKPEQALLISEKSRARALLDMVRNRVTLSNGTEAFADPLRKVADIKQIQAAVPSNTAMVVFHSNPQHTYAWVIHKGGVKALTIEESRAGLANKVRQLQQQIRKGADVDAQSKVLYQSLIVPLALKKDEPVIFVAHKALHFLPFQALLGPDGYLIEHHQVHQVPSASILTLHQSIDLKNPTLLALGNPKLASPQYDLPGAQAEVESIARLYTAPKVYLREQATRARVFEEGPGSQIIHIAAHAEVDEMDPLYSQILLAPDAIDNRNKNLEAKDIYQIDLHNTALVVLSACRSGLGNVTGGDEVFGFTRTFISAGAREVIVSLWDVEDNSTSALMNNFYHAAQKTDLPSALQQAQLALLKDPKTRHPLFWAGFNLVGTM